MDVCQKYGVFGRRMLQMQLQSIGIDTVATIVWLMRDSRLLRSIFSVDYWMRTSSF